MKRKTVCEILATEVVSGEVTQKLVGHFYLEDDKVTYELATADAGGALMFAGIFNEEIPIDFGRQIVNARRHPSQWFYALPQFFGGSSMLRARIEEPEVDDPNFEMDAMKIWEQTGRLAPGSQEDEL
jgi:hypothetical protein